MTSQDDNKKSPLRGSSKSLWIVEVHANSQIVNILLFPGFTRFIRRYNDKSYINFTLH